MGLTGVICPVSGTVDENRVPVVYHHDKKALSTLHPRVSSNQSHVWVLYIDRGLIPVFDEQLMIPMPVSLVFTFGGKIAKIIFYSGKGQWSLYLKLLDELDISNVPLFLNSFCILCMNSTSFGPSLAIDETWESFQSRPNGIDPLHA